MLQTVLTFPSVLIAVIARSGDGGKAFQDERSMVLEVEGLARYLSSTIHVHDTLQSDWDQVLTGTIVPTKDWIKWKTAPPTELTSIASLKVHALPRSLASPTKVLGWKVTWIIQTAYPRGELSFSWTIDPISFKGTPLHSTSPPEVLFKHSSWHTVFKIKGEVCLFMWEQVDEGKPVCNYQHSINLPSFGCPERHPGGFWDSSIKFPKYHFVRFFNLQFTSPNLKIFTLVDLKSRY